MEASQAGLASDADAGQQQGEQQADGQQQQAEQPDIGQLIQQQAGMSDTLEQMRDWMEQTVAQGQPGEAEQEPQQPPLSFVDPASPDYDPQQAEAAGQLLEYWQQQQQQGIQQAVQPLQQEIQTMRSEREAELLAAQFPELEDQKTADAVLEMTRDWVGAAGLPPEAANNMQVIKAVYLMGRAMELRQQEQQEGSQEPASLEGAGGASPGASAGGLTAESIIGGGARSVLPY